MLFKRADVQFTLTGSQQTNKHSKVIALSSWNQFILGQFWLFFTSRSNTLKSSGEGCALLEGYVSWVWTWSPTGWCGLLRSVNKPRGDGQCVGVFTTLQREEKPLYLADQPMSQKNDKHPQSPQVTMVTRLLSCANCPPTLICTHQLQDDITHISAFVEKVADGLVCLAVWFSRAEITAKTKILLRCTHVTAAAFFLWLQLSIYLQSIHMTRHVFRNKGHAY